VAIEEQTLVRLKSQLSRAEVLLFTGAGFCLAARDRKGRSIPGTDELKRALWAISFPSDGYDASSSLGDLYELALRRKASALRELIETRFSVDPDTLPDFYKLYFDFPWVRIYTLNVDDIELAAERRFGLKRPIKAISATATGAEDIRAVQRERLEVVHLNGMIPGPPEALTFSETQYAQRIAGPEPWYARCVADLVTRPVIFIGTELHEAPLWQHMELRRRRAGSGRDLRPTGILVSPTLTPSRRELLRDLRIEWVSESAESFAQILSGLVPSGNLGFVHLSEQVRLSGRVTVPLVSELAAERPDLETQYLLGAEPHWSDLLAGRAVVRADDEVLHADAREILSGKKPKAGLVVTGTAGTGKSTALMRLSLRLSGEGIPVFWIDRDSEAAPPLIRQRVREATGPIVLAIDDADLFGRQLVNLMRDLVPTRGEFLFVAAMRSTKVDEVCAAIRASGEMSIAEHTVPNLADADIDALIATLDRHNRLGILKGKSEAQRRAAFQAEAGRQLLVAMIQATSGRRFEEKAHDELLELEEPQRFVYALVAVASASRLYLTRDEILIGTGEVSGDALAALDRLVARHLVVAPPPTYRYRARHRVIGDLILDKLAELGQLKEVLAGLAFAAASKVDPVLDRRDRAWRLLVRVINHAFLLRVLQVPDARSVYEQVEGILSFDYHYWLQRGSLEVEAGDVRDAENFLSQALSLAPDDYRVETAYAYMQLRKAYEEPHRADAAVLAEEALGRLENAIQHRGGSDAYPYHVLGSQGLSWARRAGLKRLEHRALLERLLHNVEDGVKRHAASRELQKLHADLRREYLMTTVSTSGQQTPPA